MRGLLLYGDTERSAALRHEIPLAILDALLFAEVEGQRYVLTTRLERDRVQEALPGAEVLDYFVLGYKEFVAGGMSQGEASREVEARAVREIGLREAIVAADFPLALGDRLREDGVVLVVDEAAVDQRRRKKSPAEIEGVRAAQRAAEAGEGGGVAPPPRGPRSPTRGRGGDGRGFRTARARHARTRRARARRQAAAGRGRSSRAARRVRRAGRALPARRDRLVRLAGRRARAGQRAATGRLAD